MAGTERKESHAATRHRKSKDMMKVLEQQKFGLLQMQARDHERMVEVQSELRSALAALREKELRLASVSARLLDNKEKTTLRLSQVRMACPEGQMPHIVETASKEKEVVIGAIGKVYAAKNVKRIVARRLHHRQRAVDVAANKLDRQEEKNQKLRRDINTLRQENITFTGLFEKLREELDEAKRQVTEVQRNTQLTVAARKHARHTRIATMERMAETRQVAELEFRHQTRFMQEVSKLLEPEADAIVAGEKPQEGELSRDEEVGLQQKLQRMIWQQQIARLNLRKARERRAAYSTAIEEVKTHTGIPSLQNIVETLEAMAETKAEKVEAATRIMQEIEDTERLIEDMRRGFRQQQEENAQVNANRVVAARTIQDERAVVEEQSRTSRKEIEHVRDAVRSLFPALESVALALGCELRKAQSPSSSGRGSAQVGGTSSQPDGSQPEAPAPPESEARGTEESPSEFISLHNLFATVAVMEERASDILHRTAVLRRHAAEEAQARAQASVLQDDSFGHSDDEKEIAGRGAHLEPLSCTEGNTHLVAVGPSTAHGTLRVQMAGAAILAAVLDTTSAAAAVDDDDGSRPLTRLEAGAFARQVLSSRKVAAVKTASVEAARTLAKASGLKSFPVSGLGRSSSGGQ